MCPCVWQISALVVLVAWHIFGLITIEHNADGVAMMYGIAGAWGVGDAAFNSVRYCCLNFVLYTDGPVSASSDIRNTVWYVCTLACMWYIFMCVCGDCVCVCVCVCRGAIAIHDG